MPRTDRNAPQLPPDAVATLPPSQLSELLSRLAGRRRTAISRCGCRATGRASREDRRHVQQIVAANARMAGELERVGTVVGKQGKTRQRVRFGAVGRRLGRDGSVGQHADRRPALADDRSHPRDRRRRARATCCRPCGSTSTGGRSRASSCARPPSSTR